MQGNLMINNNEILWKADNNFNNGIVKAIDVVLK